MKKLMAIILLLWAYKSTAATLYVDCHKHIKKSHSTYNYSYPLFTSTNNIDSDQLNSINNQLKAYEENFIKKSMGAKSPEYSGVDISYTVVNQNDNFISVYLEINMNTSHSANQFFYKTFNFLRSTGQEISSKVFKQELDMHQLLMLLNSKLVANCRIPEERFNSEIKYCIDGNNIDFFFGGGQTSITCDDNSCTLSKTDYINIINRNEITEKILNNNVQTEPNLPLEIKSSRCYLYSMPSLANKSTSYIVEGDKVTLVEKQGDWCKIMYYSESLNRILIRWIKSDSIK